MNETIASHYPDIPPGRKRLKILYLKIMLFFVGKAFPLASRIDARVREELAALPPGFVFTMCVHPSGPRMSIAKTERGAIRYLGAKHAKADVEVRFRNVEAAFSVFSFHYGSFESYARNGMAVTGDLPNTMAVIRCLGIVESYLLPEAISSRILKRRISFPFGKRAFGRVFIYLGALLTR